MIFNFVTRGDCLFFIFFFFFQAEDGIRDIGVTGVQTCALPIYIAALISHFISHYARRNERAVAGITAEAIAVLQSYPWPGNVRELAAEMERLVLYTDEGCYVCAEDISERMRPVESRARAASSSGQGDR